jgi:hypothetical protein
MLGPKNKQHKKNKQFNHNRGRSSGTSVGAKTCNTWNLKTMQYIEIHKPNHSSHQIHLSTNIISNSAAAIHTQITKTFLQPNLYGIVPIIIKPKNLYEIKSTMKLMLRIHGPKDWISLGSSARTTSFFSLNIRVCMNSAFQSSAAACKQRK